MKRITSADYRRQQETPIKKTKSKMKGLISTYSENCRRQSRKQANKRKQIGENKTAPQKKKTESKTMDPLHSLTISL
jgi:hypothetical protein